MQKSIQTLHALSRICNLLTLPQRKSIIQAFIYSQFGYCPLVWMFHSRKLNHRINRIQERALRIVYNDYVSSFENLLIRDNSCTIHHRNIQTLGIELFKIVNGITPKIMLDILPLKDIIRYPNENIFQTRNVRTVRYGTDSLAHLGPKIWSIIPECIKREKTLKSFIKKIREWKPVKCPCRLCKTYIREIGYID